MKLFVTDEEKITCFNLPEKINESFLFSYTPQETNIESFINVFAKESNWYLKNDSYININDGKSEDVMLEKYGQYKLNIKGSNYQYHLYLIPAFEEKYKLISLDKESRITLGSASNMDIVIKGEYIQPQHVILTNVNGIWSINSISNSDIYVNRNRVNNTYELNIGDILFICGIKIIWMKTFIKILHLESILTVHQRLKTIDNLPSNDNLKYIKNDLENDVSLFTEEDFFYHKPRLQFINQFEQVVLDEPPSPENLDRIPFIFRIGSSLGFGLIAIVTAIISIEKYTNGQMDSGNFMLRMLTCGSTLIFSMIFPRLLDSYKNKNREKNEKLRQEKYGIYLDKKQGEIFAILNKQAKNLFETFPSAKQCFENIVGNKNKLWDKEINDSDFLSIRVGIGNIESQLKVTGPEQKFTLYDDNLLTRANTLIEVSKILKNVPITFSLKENFISALVCNIDYKDDYFNSIFIQLINACSPTELKIVMLTNDENKDKWDFIKNSPYCYNYADSIRYFATSEEDAKKIFFDIEKIYVERKNTLTGTKQEINEEIDNNILYNNFDTYYLIVTDDYKKYKNINFFDDMLAFNKNLGFSLLLLENKMRSLPNECEKFIYVVDNTSCIFEKEYVKQKQSYFAPEYEKKLDMEKVNRVLSNIPVQSTKDKIALPSMITFLDMYNIGKIEQLNILNKWKSSNPIVSLQAPVGVNENGDLFKLDLHEKAHGPHGLIAGSTGSGKSEFIITYILSMAINYDPHEVQFVLIDYKGGGLAGAFENREKGIAIPHLAGTITNLDTSEMNRTLVSIQSELKRRQVKFNELRDALGEGTIDIYKYQRFYREGKASEPIAHLFIISDEFAELKAQQPDFMDELISTARIGRSLGVHLILATQKPSGVVNDQIWSNSRFRVCLKVQTTSDSNEMLKKPDAASLKETGRFYLQVGYDELFELGQSAWTGAKYIPSEKVIKKVDDSISFINNTGDVISSVNNVLPVTNVKDNGDQLTNIVRFLCNIARENNIKTHKLWLDSIPEEIFLSNLQIKYNYKAKPFVINPIIGEYDNPSAQHQDLLTINFTKNGNAVLYGVQGSGKENLLTTLITSCCLFHGPDELNIYILDFGSESLKIFKDFPQVGDVILSDESEKILNFSVILKKEMEKRKDLFSDYMGDYKTYIKESGKIVPTILCIINMYENLSELYSTFVDNLTILFKDGSKYGIYFMVTTVGTNSLRYRIAQLFNTKLCTKLADPTDYRFVLDAPKGLIPSKAFGRGLVALENTYEFQTAYISNKDVIKPTIKSLGEKLKAQCKTKAVPVAVMPKYLLSGSLISKVKSLDEIPIGIAKTSLKIVNYDFYNKLSTPIISSNADSHVNMIYGLIDLFKQLPNVKVRVIDALKIINKTVGVDVFNQDYDTLIKQVMIELRRDSNLKKISLFIIVGLGEFRNKLNEKNKVLFTKTFNKASECKNNRFIIFDNYTSFKFLESETWFDKLIDQTNGIWIGEDAATQMAINIPNLTISEKKIIFKDIAYIVKDSKHIIVRHVIDEGVDYEE